MTFASILVVCNTLFLAAAATGDSEVPKIMEGREWAAHDVAFTARHMNKHVAELNSVLFTNNVLRPMGGGAEQWIVAFCPSWWEPCQKLDAVLSEQAAMWQSKLNKDAFTSKVRFAKVDCASEKVLCNEQQVHSYPTIAHYKDGVQIRQTNLSPRKMKEKLESWLHSNLCDDPLQVELSTTSEDSSRAAYSTDLVIILLALGASLRLVMTRPKASRTSRAEAVKVTAREEAKSEKTVLPVEWTLARSNIEL
eukprot:TRINITY_DN16822_c0_g2_i1.p1 TRINITY_DN16822_c0_g2~~TRINITY_DN16822_c0_g2_i1.p1  ORF type:complete len:251 (+),score=64.07 TRINITY_DN16822_c0_g2_i1:104-856(+)